MISKFLLTCPALLALAKDQSETFSVSSDGAVTQSSRVTGDDTVTAPTDTGNQKVLTGAQAKAYTAQKDQINNQAKAAEFLGKATGVDVGDNALELGPEQRLNQAYESANAPFKATGLGGGINNVLAKMRIHALQRQQGRQEWQHRYQCVWRVQASGRRQFCFECYGFAVLSLVYR